MLHIAYGERLTSDSCEVCVCVCVCGRGGGEEGELKRLFRLVSLFFRQKCQNINLEDTFSYTRSLK